MSTRPFKIVINEKGEYINQDLTDEEITEAQTQSAQESKERALKDAATQKQRDMMLYLEQLYDGRNTQIKTG